MELPLGGIGRNERGSSSRRLGRSVLARRADRRCGRWNDGRTTEARAKRVRLAYRLPGGCTSPPPLLSPRRRTGYSFFVKRGGLRDRTRVRWAASFTAGTRPSRRRMPSTLVPVYHASRKSRGACAPRLPDGTRRRLRARTTAVQSSGESYHGRTRTTPLSEVSGSRPASASAVRRSATLRPSMPPLSIPG